MSDSIPKRDFSSIVHKELRGIATQEEIAYLWSSTATVNLWRLELRGIVQELEEKIIIAKEEMDSINDKILKPVFHEKLKKVRDLKNLAIERIVIVKSWLKEQRRLRNTIDQEERVTFDLSCKEVYCDGWLDGISHLMSLVKQGIHPKDASILSRKHFDIYLRPWMKDEDKPFTDKPELPRSMADILSRYVNLVEDSEE
jgi:hypothetical protein